MAQVASVNNQTVTPVNGYVVEQGGKHLSSSEDQIIKKTPLTNARIMTSKITNDLFVYAPKGMKGSANSNFYEFLSLGIVPYIVGSGVFIALYNAANKAFNTQDSAAANFKGRQMAAGVILYGLGKWIGGKLINKGVEAHTGVDMDMPYKKVVSELPDFPGDKNTSAVEFHRVFESTDFPRWDLINKMGEVKGNRYEYYDKIAKKMGYKEPLSSPDQVVQPKIKETVTKALAAKSISAYMWAGLGVALAAQKPFGNFMNFKTKLSLTEKITKFPGELFKTLKSSAVDLFNGGSRATKSGKILGRALIFAAAGSTILGILNANRGFKEANKKQPSAVDFNKEYSEG